MVIVAELSVTGKARFHGHLGLKELVGIEETILTPLGTRKSNTPTSIHSTHINPLVPSKTHYGHCNVGNANNRKSVKNKTSNFWSSNLWIYNTHLRKINFQFRVVQLSKYLWTKGENNANTWKYNKYSQIQHMCYAIFLLFGS